MLPKYRCHSVQCEFGYNRGLPAHVNAINCAGGCGVAIYCSESCEREHRKSHGRACPFIRLATLSTPRREESESERRAASKAIDLNLSTPAFYFKGRAERRRFRVGQRVQCSMAPINEWVNGTVVTLFYRFSEDGHFPYEIELDSGVYCSAPEDTDQAIRRVVGAPVVRGPHPLTHEVATLADAEMRDFAICERICDDVLPNLDRHLCQGCGYRSESKLMCCSRCRVGVYCSSDCQRRMYALHKPACKEVVACLEEIVLQGHCRVPPGAKSAIRKTALNETLKQHLQSTGEPSGGAGFLATLLFRSRSQGHRQALEALARLLSGCGGPLYQTFEGSPAGLSAGDMETTMGDILITTDSLARLVHGVVTFAQSNPPLANLFAAGVKLFWMVSYYRPLVPYQDREDPAPKAVDKSDFGKLVQLTNRAKEGDLGAHYELGLLLCNQSHMEETRTRRRSTLKSARKHLKKAAKGGHTSAQQMLEQLEMD
jgi:hypothetical protein